MCESVYARGHVCGDPRLMLGVFLNRSSLYQLTVYLPECGTDWLN